jgi:hypothetical protein
VRDEVQSGGIQVPDYMLDASESDDDSSGSDDEGVCSSAQDNTQPERAQGAATGGSAGASPDAEACPAADCLLRVLRLQQIAATETAR